MTEYHAMVDRAEDMEKVRASSPTKLSWEMTRLLALVMFADYVLFPNHGDPCEISGQ